MPQSYSDYDAFSHDLAKEGSFKSSSFWLDDYVNSTMLGCLKGGDDTTRPKTSQASQPTFPPTLPLEFSCDSKPRLMKEQHDILEDHFQKQNKPNANTMMSFAKSLDVSVDEINVGSHHCRSDATPETKR